MQNYDNEPKGLRELIQPSADFYQEAFDKLKLSAETYEFLAVSFEQYLHEEVGAGYGVGNIFPIQISADGNISVLPLGERERLIVEYLSLAEEKGRNVGWADYELRKFFKERFLFGQPIVEFVVEFSNPAKLLEKPTHLEKWFIDFDSRWKKYVQSVIDHFKIEYEQGIDIIVELGKSEEKANEILFERMSYNLWFFAYPQLVNRGRTIKDAICSVIFSRPLSVDALLAIVHNKLKKN